MDRSASWAGPPMWREIVIAMPLADARIVVVSTEQPGRRMAGPAIRALHLARELAAQGADVRLAAPQPTDVELGVPVVAFESFRADRFRALASGADVVLTQPLRVDVARGLHGSGARIVYDLYVPSFVEYPAAHGGEARRASERDALITRNRLEYATALSCGDAFVCASARQRDHWLGALGQAGRLYPLDDAPGAGVGPPVVVVPFGLPDEPAPARRDLAALTGASSAGTPGSASPTRITGEPVVRGPLVPADSFVVLWTGGLWNWFDPATLLHGLAGAVARNPRIRLVVMAAGHASEDWTAHRAGEDAEALATQLGLTQSGHVMFAGRWVPFEERGGFLAEADLGVCSYYDSDETRLSFRTRYLDHLWAGLPTLSTAGGALTEAMVLAGAARTAPAQDASAWTEGLLQLASDEAARSAMSQAARRMSAEYRWSVVVRPLIDLLAGMEQVPAGRAPSLADTSRYLAVALRNRVDARLARS